MNIFGFFTLVSGLFFSTNFAWSQELNVAAVQFPIVGKLSNEAFEKKVRTHLEAAKKQEVDLILLPELLSLDLWPLGSKKTDLEVVSEIEAKNSRRYIERLQKWAKEFNLVIVGGSIPLRSPQGKLRNTAIVAFPNGKLEMQHKIFLTPWDKEIGFESGTELQVFQVEKGEKKVNFYVLICFDSEFPRLSWLMSQNKLNPDLILVPSMTESQSGFYRVKYSAQARAVEQHSYVVVTGTVGKTAPSWQHFGQALFVGPQDKGFPPLLKQGPFNQESLVMHRLDIEKLRKSRSKSGYVPAKEDQGQAVHILSP